MDARKNFAFGTLASGINSAATSLDVGSGEGARFPAVSFNAVIWQSTDYSHPAAAYHAGDAEIVRVTGISTDTLTITRAQEGTSAVNLNTGGKTYQIWAGPTDGYWDQLYANGDIMTTRGDLVRRGASNPERFALGGFGKLLLSDATDPDWFDAANFAIFFDDFISEGQSSIYGEHWLATNNNGSITQVAGEQSAPGVVQCSTSSSAAGAPYLWKTFNSHKFGGGKLIYRTRIKLSNLSDGAETYTIKVGFLNNHPTPSSGIWFEYSHGSNSGNWMGKASNASSVTTVNGSTAADTNWTILEMVVAADGASVEFFVNGSSIGTASSNIPTSNASGLVSTIIKSAGTSARTMQIDYVLAAQKLTTSR